MADEQNITNEQEQAQSEPLHTAREAELENDINELKRQMQELRAENQRLYRRFTGSEQNEPSPAEKLEQQMRDVRAQVHAPAIEKMNLKFYRRSMEGDNK